MYKCAKGGVHLAVVDPRNTSKTCAQCGHCERANRNGKIELSELPGDVREEMRVIVTFVEPRGVALGPRGIDQAQAAKLRDSLAAFAEDWESPEMEVYDDYDAARAQSS